MKWMLVCLLVTSALLLSSSAYAHDAKYHKGKPVHGTVLSITTDGFDLQTDKGQVKVSYAKEVAFEKGEAVAKKDDVKQGMHVSVIGTKLESGEIVAHEVIFEEHHDDDHH